MSKTSETKNVAGNQSEVNSLAAFIKEHFPEEANSADLSNPTGVTEATLRLLDRLWRWEN